MLRVKTCWISDLHLGSTQCQADKLLDFLKILNTEKLYLVGDIIDFWALSRKSFWPTTHNSVFQKILKMAKNGVEVIYIPGNHDSPVRDLAGMTFGNVKIKLEDIHELTDGRKFLITHGDEFDTITRYHQWICKLGALGYDLLLQLNRAVRFLQRTFKMRSTFSLSAYLKYKVKNAVKFISDYESDVINVVKNRGLSGIVCGHIHHPELREDGDFTYLNTGDWVESLSALLERYDGTIELYFYGKNANE